MSEALFSGWQPPPPQQPKLELIELVWELASPKGRVLSCGLYRTVAGMELRVAYPEDDLVRSELVRSPDVGRHRAQSIRDALMTQGFTESAISTDAPGM